VLAIQRTLHGGPAAGIATGLGAAFADALYGALGAFGVNAVIDRLVGARVALALFGALFLGVMAWRIWSQPVGARSDAPAARGRWLVHLASTFVLTLANPSTILSFVAVFGLLAAGTVVPAAPWVMVGGVFVGSALWWLLLAAAVGRLRHRFDARWQRCVNRVSALVLAAFAAGGLVVAARG
jgi:threonine/homoserine/homoserine lactone efflux protein